MKNIQYKTTKNFSENELKELFLSVNWSSGNYPEKLVIAMENSSSVFSLNISHQMCHLYHSQMCRIYHS